MTGRGGGGRRVLLPPMYATCSLRSVATASHVRRNANPLQQLHLQDAPERKLMSLKPHALGAHETVIVSELAEYSGRAWETMGCTGLESTRKRTRAIEPTSHCSP